MSEDVHEQVQNLDSVDFTNFQHKITSPRSIQACRKLGVEIKELYFIDLETFKNSSFELKNLDKELLKNRFDHHERIRMATINQVKAERHKIIEDAENKKKTSQTLEKSSSSEQKFYSSAIEIEKKEIEKIKFRQKKEIEAMIEYEIKMECIKKNNEDKIRRQQEKQDAHLAEIKAKRAKEDEEKRKREEEKAEKLRLEEEELQRQLKEKHDKERKRIGELLFMEQEKARENMKKAMEQREKQEKFKEEIERVQKHQQNIALQKQKEMEIKDNKRRAALNEKRERDIRNSQQAKQARKQKIELTRKNLDNKIEEQKIIFNEKQKKNEEKRLTFEKNLSNMHLQKKLESEKREAEIKKVLESNKEGEKKKLQDYYKKQEQIKLLKLELDKEREKENEEHKMRLQMRRENLKKGKERNDMQEIEKKQRIQKKIEHTDVNIQKQRQINEMNHMNKHEQEALKVMDKKLYLGRLEKMSEYEMNNKMEEIRAKEIKMNEIKKEKYLMLCKKREMAEAVSRQKKEVKERFDIVMKKHKGITEEALNELFPDDKELVARLMEMKRSIGKDISLRNTDEKSFNNDSNNNLNHSGKNVHDETAFARTGNQD